MSCPPGECSTEKSEQRVGHIAEPEWCLVVSTAYPIPARRARRATASGFHETGSNIAAEEWYCSTLTDWHIGNANTPSTSGHDTSRPCWLAWSQWTNIPKRASSNHEPASRRPSSTGGAYRDGAPGNPSYLGSDRPAGGA